MDGLLDLDGGGPKIIDLGLCGGSGVLPVGMLGPAFAGTDEFLE
jgi:hypothetical protein